MSVRKQVISILPVIFLSTGCSESIKQDLKPNVVVMYIDDLDFDELGYYGSINLTPNIDKLASEGMNFTRAYVTSTVCTPSRYGLVTGNYASRSIAIQENPASTWRNRLYPPGTDANVHFNCILTPGEKTFGNYMHEAGYVTGMVGKWHMGGSAKGEYIYKDSDGNFTKPKIPLNKEESYDSPYNQQSIKEHYKTITNYIKENFGFDFVDGFFEQNASGLRQSGYPEIYQKHNLEWITANGQKFIRENKDIPFFLYYALTLPHGEQGGFKENIESSELTITPGGRIDKMPETGMPDRNKLSERCKAADLKPASMAMMYVDDAVGALLNTLKEEGLEENTIVMFISDHGNYAKLALFEGGVRVPFIVKWPGIVKAGSSNDQIIANIDVTPTILEISESNKEISFDGISFLSLLKGSKESIREALLIEVGYAKAIVTKESKLTYIRFPEEEKETIEGHGGIDGINYNASNATFAKRQKSNYPGYWDLNQLYDLVNDSAEQKNIYSDNPEKLEGLEELMKRELDKLPHTFGEIKVK
ncbi:MAG: sulfatase-like hydrolase/transferase [Bacteroidales bacterium]|nr:sulfatase-like hydrolase/transferase [Bacteroidales bacterium]